VKIKRNNIIIVIFFTLFLAATPWLVAAQNGIEELRKEGDAAESVGNYSQAEHIWREVLQLEPNSADAYIKLGNALRQQKKLEAAIAAYKEAIKLDSNSAEALHPFGKYFV
jgi:tetratricopeptide (TPR) repeat protein